MGSTTPPSRVEDHAPVGPEPEAPAGGAAGPVAAGPGNVAVARMLGDQGVLPGEGRVSPALDAALDAERGGGTPLPDDARAGLEQHLGADFAGVRVHTGPGADSLSRSIDAEAFTTGTDVFFRAGRYDPEGTAGRGLLAHELTHVVQQSTGAAGRAGEISRPDDPAERQAADVSLAYLARTAHPAPAAGAGEAVPFGLLQAGGNHAVARLLQRAPAPGTVIQRDPDAKAPSGPTLAPGRNFEWRRSGMTYVVLIAKQWLLSRNVGGDAVGITEPGVLSEILTGLPAVAPWVDLAVLAKHPAFTEIMLTKPLSEQPDTLAVPAKDEAVSMIGNPPGEDILLRRTAQGVQVWVDTGLIRRTVKHPGAVDFQDANFTAQIFGALETWLGQEMGAGREPGWRTGFYADWLWTLPGPADKLDRSAAFGLAPDDLADLFGPDWMKKATSRAGADAGRVKGHTVQLPASMKEDWPQILAVMREILGPPDPAKAKDEPKMPISERAAELLNKIAKSPFRAKIIERIRGGGGGAEAKKGTSLADMLESVIAEQELGDARKRLDLGDPGSGGEDPVVNRPVHGDIVLTGGRPVPDKEAVFTFQPKDEVDALRSPLIRIQWFAYPQGKPNRVLDRERNTYSPLRPDGPINDKLFEVTFPRAGTYVVEAIVGHNFYRPASFRTEVKVLTEGQEADYQEKDALAGFAVPKGAATKEHTFDVGGLSGLTGSYDEGTITRGKIDPKFLDPKFQEGALPDRLKSIDGEIARVDKLMQQYAKASGGDAAAVYHWAEDYLKSLRAGRTKIETDAKDKRLIPCTGVYVSRSGKAPSKALNLVCLQKRTDTGYEVSLHDLSQVYEAENYQYEVENSTAEGAYEEIFVEHSKSYPDGTLSVAFQGWDEKKQEPTGSYVKFRLVTDTVGGDIKQTVFDPAVNIVVNVAAAVMMVVPGLQVAGFALAIIYNTSQTISELESKAAKGTLKDEDYVYAGAQFALDVLPVIGRTSRMVSLGKKAFYVIEMTQAAGQVLLITAQAAAEVEKVRNGVIAKLARLTEQLDEMLRVNPANPQIEVLRAEQDRLILEGRDAVIAVGGRIVAQQGLMVVGGGLIQQAAIKKFGARLSELENLGRFDHRPGEPVRFDYAERKIVGDRQAMTEAQFDAAERTAVMSGRLEATVPDPAIRQKIVETLGTGPVEIVTGAKKTQLVVEDGKKVLQVADGARPDEVLAHASGAKGGPAGHTPAGTDPQPATTPAKPQFGLDAERTQKLLDAVTPEQAALLHEYLGDNGLRKLADTQAGNIKSVGEAFERAKAAAGTDPRAAEGLARMGSKQHAKAYAMAPSTIVDILSTVPPGRMELFLRVLADPDMPHPRQLGEPGLKRLASNSDELGFIGEFGGKAYGELRGDDLFDTLLTKLRGLEPGQAAELVDAVRSAKGKVARREALRVEPPARVPRRASGKVAPNKALPGWDEHVRKAKEFAAAHDGQLDRNGREYRPDDEQIEMLATMYQVRENARLNRALSHDQRVQMLDEFDQLGREAGLQTTWINNLRGNMSEVLFTPNVGANKTRMPHPDGGFTILDYAFDPGQRPGSSTGRKEWVEQKSDLITAPPGSTDVFRPAVGRAKRYADEAALDLKAINHGAGTKGDTILIDFVRRPGNEATEKAMLAQLFGPASPIQAVKFADGPWIERGAWLAANP